MTELLQITDGTDITIILPDNFSYQKSNKKCITEQRIDKYQRSETIC
jgi:hypothetical protein|tara:strand:- start:103 stop:243 length:141 start_codon:yes stop_codon:yes gene_type:complete